jgi:hypothetical protein
MSVSGVDNNCNLIDPTPHGVYGTPFWTWSIGGNSGTGSSVTTNFDAQGTYTCNFTATATNCPGSPITTSASASVTVQCPLEDSFSLTASCAIDYPGYYGGYIAYCIYCPGGGLAAGWYFCELVTAGSRSCCTNPAICWINPNPNPVLTDGCLSDQIEDPAPPATIPCSDTTYQTLLAGPTLSTLGVCSYNNLQQIVVGGGTVYTSGGGAVESCSY